MQSIKVFKFKNLLKKAFTAPRLVLLSFLAVIFAGAVLLSLPVASSSGEGIPFYDALFTATSATCVTGLSVNIVRSDFTLFGHIIILLLIQVGGLGIMTISSSLYLFIGKRFTLYNRMTLGSDFDNSSFKEFTELIFSIIKIVFITEFVGAILLSVAYLKYYPVGTAVWYGVFHSVSAFCNAGFDILSPNGTNLAAFSSDPFVLLTIAALIIIGGLGFIVIVDILQKKRWKRLSLHTKVVLPITAALLVFGTVFFLIAEWNNMGTLGTMRIGDKIVNAFFQSTTTRTAGFSTFSNANLSQPSYPVTIFLMFIGASPGSTGGGLKTTTFFILLAAIIPTMLNKRSVVLDKHRIGAMTIKKSATMLMLALSIIFVSSICLIISESANFSNEQLVFELISAYSTVGLSMNVTTSLSIFGKYIVMLNMFLGRVGSYTFFIALMKNSSEIEPKIKFPEANFHF